MPILVLSNESGFEDSVLELKKDPDVSKLELWNGVLSPARRSRRSMYT